MSFIYSPPRGIQSAGLGTVATTGNTDQEFIIGGSGFIESIDVSGRDALAANNTNYLTFTVVNLGQDGLGATNILDAVDGNTTKLTGGSALSAGTKRSLILSSTPANLNCVVGDRIRVRAAATGTLANTVSFFAISIRLRVTNS